VSEYTQKKMERIRARYLRLRAPSQYTPKQMKRIWARTLRYLACEDPKRAQLMFDRLHADVDGRCSHTKFTNQVRRTIGLPEQALRAP
jgi:hypothetical protein